MIKRLIIFLINPISPKKYFSDAQKYWESLVSDTDAIFDKEIDINANEVLPQVTWEPLLR